MRSVVFLFIHSSSFRYYNKITRWYSSITISITVLIDVCDMTKKNEEKSFIVIERVRKSTTLTCCTVSTKTKNEKTEQKQKRNLCCENKMIHSYSFIQSIILSHHNNHNHHHTSPSPGLYFILIRI